MKEIKIKYLDGANEVKAIKNGDWIDLYAYDNYIYEVGAFFMVNLGVSMKLPEGYEAHLAMRSGTFKKYGLIQTNAVGVIDESYCGNDDIWHLPVYCLAEPVKPAHDPIHQKEIYDEGDTGKIENKKLFVIKKGDRLCQFRIMKKMQAEEEIKFTKVDNMEDESRGGFGNSGI